MEELYGHIELDGKRFPFAFEEDKLKIFPIEKQEETKKDEYEELAPGIYISTLERGKIIEEIELKGMLVDGRNITFKVYDDPSQIEGFYKYTVISSYIYRLEERVPIFEDKDGIRKIKKWETYANAIDGVIISGREIDMYYDPSRVFVHRYTTKSGSLQFSEFNVTATTNDDEDCGTFSVGNIECNMMIRSIAKVTSSKVPFNSFSELVLVFSKSITLAQAEDIVSLLRNCFQYLTRRLNVEFSNIETFCNTKDGKKRRFGKYKSYRYKNIEENNPKAIRQIIGHDVIGNKLGRLMQSFIKEEMYLNHLPYNMEDDRKFGPDRMIFDFVAFEREYQNLYPENIVRSEAFIKAKELAISAIDNEITGLTGKKRDYLKSILSSVSKIENGLGERIRYVMNDCKEIMKPFLIYNYTGDYSEQIESMYARMNQIRNDCAHGNIQTSFDGTILIDYNTLECLHYAMRLKALEISNLKSQKAIASVMNINMYIPDEDEESNESVEDSAE